MLVAMSLLFLVHQQGWTPSHVLVPLASAVVLTVTVISTERRQVYHTSSPSFSVSCSVKEILVIGIKSPSLLNNRCLVSFE